MAHPLRKVKRTGEQYLRPPPIEEALDRALQQDVATLRRRSGILDETSTDYLPSECLVGLIRAAGRRDDEALMSLLLTALLKRCEVVLQRHVSAGLPMAEDIRQDVLNNLVVLFVEDRASSGASVLDYYEAKFNDAFRGLYVDEIRRAKAKANPVERVQLEREDDAAEHSTVEEAFSRLRADALLQDLSEAIHSLPELEKKIVTLHHLIGHEIESLDPNKRTVATICEMSGRNVRYYLKSAMKRLEELLCPQGD